MRTIMKLTKAEVELVREHRARQARTRRNARLLDKYPAGTWVEVKTSNGWRKAQVVESDDLPDSYIRTYENDSNGPLTINIWRAADVRPLKRKT